MEYPAVFLPDIKDSDAAQLPGIRILSSAFREKGGTVGLYLLSVFYSFAGNHFCSKFSDMAVLIEQFFRDPVFRHL